MTPDQWLVVFCVFGLPIMILFGTAIPWAEWNRDGRSALFAGWFGLIGAAALFYAMLIQEQTGSTEYWPFISLAIGASVLAHGVTGTPLTRLFGGEAAAASLTHGRKPT